MIPLPNRNYLNSSIRPNPDLYGAYNVLNHEEIVTCIVPSTLIEYCKLVIICKIKSFAIICEDKLTANNERHLITKIDKQCRQFKKSSKENIYSQLQF